jgi:hypothetical protein
LVVEGRGAISDGSPDALDGPVLEEEEGLALHLVKARVLAHVVDPIIRKRHMPHVRHHLAMLYVSNHLASTSSHRHTARTL